MSKGLADLPEIQLDGDDIMSGRLAGRLAQMAIEHGPIFKWVIPNGMDAGEYVFMVGPEANRFVLHTGREHFSHDLGWTPIIGDTLGKGLLNMDPPEHTRHRKMWNPAFTSAAIEAYLPVIERVVAARTAAWPGRAEVDVYDEAREITFDAAAAALAGFTPGPQVDDLRRLFYTLIHGFDPGDDASFEAFLQRAMSARDELAGKLMALIAERRARPEDAQPRDVVGMIVRARDEDGRPLRDEQILAHINILLVAGHETTTPLSAWVLYLLATMPEQRRRIEAEIDSLLAAGASLTVEALRGMKQLDNFIKETGRLYPPVINVPRGALSEFTFGGYTIPAGTPIRLALGAGHLLPQVFAEPRRFDPDRFAPPREEDRRTPYGLVTFSGGARICIGINFAQIETKALAAHVLRHYRLEAVEGQRIVHAGHWTALLEHGIRLRVRRAP
jgi:cytochrome P450